MFLICFIRYDIQVLSLPCSQFRMGRAMVSSALVKTSQSVCLEGTYHHVIWFTNNRLFYKLTFIDYIIILVTKSFFNTLINNKTIISPFFLYLTYTSDLLFAYFTNIFFNIKYKSYLFIITGRTF